MDADIALTSRSNEAGPSTSAYSHISRASAAKAIQYLDSYAFPSTFPSSSISSLKRRKVSEVDSGSNQNASHKSSMTGLSHLYRERARQRRKSKVTFSEANTNKKEQVNKVEQSASFQPFSLSLLLERLATFSISTYSSKPGECRKLDPVTLAMQGWKHSSGKERDMLTCATCQAEWKAAIPAEVNQRDRIVAWKEVDDSVPSRHLHWCPWRLRGCHCEYFPV